LEECQQFVGKTLKQKRELEPDPEVEDEATEEEEAPEEAGDAGEDAGGLPAKSSATTVTGTPGTIVVGMISDIEPHEAAMWDNAVKALRKDGVKKGLDVLFSASCSVSSVREKNRYRLMMAKLCLQAGRHDLAHPIAEELNTMVEELGLERWESPVWVGDVLGAYYRCLVQSEDSEENYKADEIFKKMCTIDLTKALQHKQSQ
jgi:type VI secretion system protein ImpA